MALIAYLMEHKVGGNTWGDDGGVGGLLLLPPSLPLLAYLFSACSLHCPPLAAPSPSLQNNFGPHLIIVPNAVMVNWKSELQQWLPTVRGGGRGAAPSEVVGGWVPPQLQQWLPTVAP